METDISNGSPERRLILHMSVSLDGFVARTDGVIDWLSSEGAGGVDHGIGATGTAAGQIGTIVMGRGAYEDMFKRTCSRAGLARTIRWPC